MAKYEVALAIPTKRSQVDIPDGVKISDWVKARAIESLSDHGTVVPESVVKKVEKVDLGDGHTVSVAVFTAEVN